MVFFLTTSYNPGFFSSFVVITEVTSPTIGKCLLMRSSKRACLSSGRVLTRKNERELQITTTLLPIGFRIAGPYKKLGFVRSTQIFSYIFLPRFVFLSVSGIIALPPMTIFDINWKWTNVSYPVKLYIFCCWDDVQIIESPPPFPSIKPLFFDFVKILFMACCEVEIFNLYVLLILQNV